MFNYHFISRCIKLEEYEAFRKARKDVREGNAKSVFNKLPKYSYLISLENRAKNAKERLVMTNSVGKLLNLRDEFLKWASENDKSLFERVEKRIKELVYFLVYQIGLFNISLCWVINTKNMSSLRNCTELAVSTLGKNFGDTPFGRYHVGLEFGAFYSHFCYDEKNKKSIVDTFSKQTKPHLFGGKSFLRIPLFFILPSEEIIESLKRYLMENIKAKTIALKRNCQHYFFDIMTSLGLVDRTGVPSHFHVMDFECRKIRKFFFSHHCIRFMESVWKYPRTVHFSHLGVYHGVFWHYASKDIKRLRNEKKERDIQLLRIANDYFLQKGKFGHGGEEVGKLQYLEEKPYLDIITEFQCDVLKVFYSALRVRLNDYLVDTSSLLLGLDNVIGEGICGTVYRVKLPVFSKRRKKKEDQQEIQEFAFKCIKRNVPIKKAKSEVRRLCEMFITMNNLFIIGFRGLSLSDGRIGLILELCNESVREFMSRKYRSLKKRQTQKSSSDLSKIEERKKLIESKLEDLLEEKKKVMERLDKYMNTTTNTQEEEQDEIERILIRSNLDLVLGKEEKLEQELKETVKQLQEFVVVPVRIISYHNAICFDVKMRILLQTACACRYLHSINLMHRDLKWDNVLISKTGKIRICDFGSSKKFVEFENSFRVGTIWYCAPEVLFGKRYSLSCDVYSFGVMIYQLLYGITDFKKVWYKNLEEFRKRLRWRPDIESSSNHVPKYLQKLISQCWNKDVQKRPSFEYIYSIYDVLRFQGVVHHKNKRKFEDEAKFDISMCGKKNTNKRYSRIGSLKILKTPVDQTTGCLSRSELIEKFKDEEVRLLRSSIYEIKDDCDDEEGEGETEEEEGETEE